MTHSWKNFKIWNIFMFLGCLVLSIFITMPILATADSEQWENVVIDLEFSPTRNISADSVSVWNINDSIYISATWMCKGGSCFDLFSEWSGYNAVVSYLNNQSDEIGTMLSAIGALNVKVDSLEASTFAATEYNNQNCSENTLWQMFYEINENIWSSVKMCLYDWWSNYSFHTIYTTPVN